MEYAGCSIFVLDTVCNVDAVVVKVGRVGWVGGESGIVCELGGNSAGGVWGMVSRVRGRAMLGRDGILTHHLHVSAGMFHTSAQPSHKFL